MPERGDYRTDPTLPTEKPRPRYMQVLVAVFVLPLVVFGRRLFRGADPRAVLLGFALVTLVGWAWSITLSANLWWVFPKRFLVGVWLLPNLPLEEMLFYPIGMLFAIGLYNALTRRWPERMKDPWPYRAYLYAGTAVFGALAFYYRDEKPYYIYSLLLVYNGLALALCEAVWRYIHPRPLFVLTALLFVIGLVWDYFAFRYDWWIYNPIMGLKFWGIPVEDVDFYLYAPPAGLSLYLLAVRHFDRR
jgi:hypothetical protein